MPHMQAARYWVALRKESVDRNFAHLTVRPGFQGSLSARRAWIEILIFRLQRSGTAVALRKESVDRNRSPPVGILNGIVALRKESVDRNRHSQVIE